jgi:molybdopterin/thiamine biosynthesis adenylyltransferase
MEGIFDAIRNSIDVTVLEQVRLLVLGVGRVGFAFLSLAIHHGVRQIWVMDFDKVRARNFASGFPESEVGSDKAEYVATELKYRRGDADVWYSKIKLQSDNVNTFVSAFEWATHICYFFDSFNVASELVKLSYSLRPNIYAALLDQGQVGEAAWSVPGQTPCINCTARLSEKRGARGGQTLLVDVVSTASLAFRQFLGLCLVGSRGFELFQPLVHPRYCLGYTINGPGGFLNMSEPDTPCGVRLVEVVSEQGIGPFCSTCIGYRP